MFETPGPRIFGLPPGVDFAEAFVRGLRDRISGPPEALARVEIYVNTERMARRLRRVFDQGPACLLPRIGLVTDLADPLTRAGIPAPEPDLRMRLRLTEVISKLLDLQPDLAARTALFDLSDSLAALLEEMQGEGVSAETVSDLDVSDQSGHWQRAQMIYSAVAGFVDSSDAPTRAAFNRLALTARIAAWQASPPQHPVLVAGSTGSRGTTAEFMRAVACLPQGAVILPGFDFDMPQSVWAQLDNPLTGEDHPQFRFARLLQGLDLAPADIMRWTDDAAPAPERNRVLSLALRPAPVTHQWLSEGPGLPVLPQAMRHVTLLRAQTPRDEARAIALRLRQAAEDGTRAALITPDRMLTRQVTSALDQWGIVPDDSAGTPAQLTPPGRFLRHVAALFQAPLSAEALLTLLKHPLAHTGAGRGDHLRHTRDLELHIRKTGMPFPDPVGTLDWGAKPDRASWATWIAETFCNRTVPGRQPLSDWVTRHIALAEAIAAGADSTDARALWDRNEGRALRDITDTLLREARHGTEMDARDYAELFGAIVARGEVRDRDEGHPHILIWGTLEARVMDAELLILAGLNEGSWPEMPSADPWLNRAMRAKAGLLLPERRIGLSAHDFQQAAAAPEVWLSRALKTDDAETVPSRWLNRLINLLTGLPERNGPKALEEMAARGTYWLALAHASERPITATSAPRPSPAPPVEARPEKLPVTQIKRLIRDPYAVYARYVLRLRALDPLMRAPDALMRGILLHEVFEQYLRDVIADPGKLTAEALSDVAAGIVGNARIVPFPTTRALWQARIDRVAQWFAATEQDRQSLARPDPANFEVRGAAPVPGLAFVLEATADRIDIDAGGHAHVYDYKTGKAPSGPEQKSFDKQLLLEAAMLERGAFDKIDSKHVARAVYISLTPSDPKESAAPLEDAPTDQVWEDFTRLMRAYSCPTRGYTARRALLRDTDSGDYDHLARFGEWDVTDTPEREDLT